MDPQKVILYPIMTEVTSRLIETENKLVFITNIKAKKKDVKRAVEELYEVKVDTLGEDTFRVRLTVHNTGWLPTYVTKQALETKVVRGVVCEIELPDGAKLETGERREELGQLEGRAYKPAALTAADATDDRAKVEWVLRAPLGGTVGLVARHERAGVVRTAVEL